ncbi:hypothetical protein RUND412_006449 [Rhizina undulata]
MNADRVFNNAKDANAEAIRRILVTIDAQKADLGGTFHEFIKAQYNTFTLAKELHRSNAATVGAVVQVDANFVYTKPNPNRAGGQTTKKVDIVIDVDVPPTNAKDPRPHIGWQVKVDGILKGGSGHAYVVVRLGDNGGLRNGRPASTDRYFERLIKRNKGRSITNTKPLPKVDAHFIYIKPAAKSDKSGVPQRTEAVITIDVDVPGPEEKNQHAHIGFEVFANNVLVGKRGHCYVIDGVLKNGRPIKSKGKHDFSVKEYELQVIEEKSSNGEALIFKPSFRRLSMG